MGRILVLTAFFILLFVSCDQSTNDEKNGANTTKLPSLIIKNQSSFILSNVKFSGISFSLPDSDDLFPETYAIQQLAIDDLNKIGYINFTRKDTGIVCRTESISITDHDYTFTFTDNTVVEEIGNSSNKRILSRISFLPKIIIERNNLSIVKNDLINLNDTVTNNSQETLFTIKNTGVGILSLGTNPVKINGAEDVFSVVQPIESEIASNGVLTFKIMVNPRDIGPHSSVVTVSSNDQYGDFNFIITVMAVAPKPIVAVFVENTEISQNGIIDIGGQMISMLKNIVVTIRNAGTEILMIDTANIAISGANAAMFAQKSVPNDSIAAGDETSFIIEYAPANVGEHNAVMAIPVNDNFRNPVIVFFKATAIPVFSVMVTYNANGGIGEIPSAQTVTAFSDITLPGGDGLSKDGFIFGGWLTNTTGTGVSYNAHAAYTATSNITLYVKWIIDMVWIPPGIFIMGSPETEPRNNRYETQHQVTLTNGFYMGVHEVTQAQYVAVTGVNPTWTKRPHLPVERVTWYDAVEFCNKLSIMEGLEQVYTIIARIPLNGYPITDAIVIMDRSKNGYRLPTEAEWEYACRAGTITAYNTGDNITTNQANFGNVPFIIGLAMDVESFEPNAWGLYDMHGNVSEWCWDFYVPYLDEPQIDPIGGQLSPIAEILRVCRGGSYYSDTRYVRSASRLVRSPHEGTDTGFRLVRR